MNRVEWLLDHLAGRVTEARVAPRSVRRKIYRVLARAARLAAAELWLSMKTIPSRGDTLGALIDLVRADVRSGQVDLRTVACAAYLARVLETEQ